MRWPKSTEFNQECRSQSRIASDPFKKFLYSHGRLDASHPIRRLRLEGFDLKYPLLLMDGKFSQWIFGGCFSYSYQNVYEYILHFDAPIEKVVKNRS